jgi:methionyl-tRNA formyltransferase
MTDLSILYFGMFGELSRRPLAALLESGAHICGVIVPGTNDQPEPVPLDPPEIDLPGVDFIPMVSEYMQPSVITVAWEHHLPLLSIGDLNHAQTLPALTAFQPDLIVVSCFSKIIPPAILQLPRMGAINLHPSLLPRYRGPSPFFWQLRNGETDTGVTVHYLNEQLDAGEILLQVPVRYPDGLSGAQAGELCAQAGSRLLVQALDLLRRGAAPRIPQDESQATYQSLPARDDLIITTDWSARRAFNFLRGVDSPNGPLPFDIIVGDQTFRVGEALSYSADEKLANAFERNGDNVAIQFEPGVLRIRS